MLKEEFNTPILFLVFNRPDTTKLVFEAIRNIRPRQLFIAADGPRETVFDDFTNCNLVKKIVGEVDWKCEVKTLFRDENLGCGIAVSEAITWFFDNVEQGIILEDDCLPHPTFFNYCEMLLNRYKDDNEIMIISGNNFQDGIQRGDGSYYFSKYTHIWGWATWRRTWLQYDFYMEKWPNYLENKLLTRCNGDTQQYSYWKSVFAKTYKGEINTWDYQLAFASWCENNLNILPNVNLVANIGFGADATHTKEGDNKFSNMDTYAYWDDIIPSKKVIDDFADLYTFNMVFNPKLVKRGNKMKLVSILKLTVKRLVRKLMFVFEKDLKNN